MTIFLLGKDYDSTALRHPEHGTGYQFLSHDELGWLIAFNAILAVRYEELYSLQDEILSATSAINRVLALSDDGGRISRNGDISIISAPSGYGDRILETLMGEATRIDNVSLLQGEIKWLQQPPNHDSRGNVRYDAGYSGAPTEPVGLAEGGLRESSVTSGDDFFARFSAFKIDRRYDASNGRYLAGTYWTSWNDARHVPSGLAAVARYALPNAAPAIYVTQMLPAKGIGYSYGTVRPDFNQSGGGVEVYFDEPVRPTELGKFRVSDL